MRSPRWVSRLVLEAVHLDQVREHGGLSGLRDEDALEAALARARQKWTYEPSVGLATLAAAYGYGIARAHPFRDGNRRIAFLAMVVFLGLNGADLDATETDVVQAMIALAAGTLDEEELATWIRMRLTRAAS